MLGYGAVDEAETVVQEDGEAWMDADTIMVHVKGRSAA
jgi:hypothetical protein